MGIFAHMGIGNHENREKNDFYATHPRAMEDLLKREQFSVNVWEPACGTGNLSEVLKKHGHNVYSTDLIDRGYSDDTFDFLQSNIKFDGDIITNPPFKHTIPFILKSLESIEMGNKVAMFLKLNYLSGVQRYKEIYSKFPPYKVYVYSRRIPCSKNNDPDGFKTAIMDYAWFIWEKGKLGPTELKWIYEER